MPLRWFYIKTILLPTKTITDEKLTLWKSCKVTQFGMLYSETEISCGEYKNLKFQFTDFQYIKYRISEKYSDVLQFRNEDNYCFPDPFDETS